MLCLFCGEICYEFPTAVPACGNRPTTFERMCCDVLCCTTGVRNSNLTPQAPGYARILFAATGREGGRLTAELHHTSAGRYLINSPLTVGVQTNFRRFQHHQRLPRRGSTSVRSRSGFSWTFLRPPKSVHIRLRFCRERALIPKREDY